MNPPPWRHMLPYYLAFVLAFPLGMAWVETHAIHGPTPCVFRRVTGLDCPSCGLTRAFRSMGRLDVSAAIRYNPLGPLIFFVVLTCWGVALGQMLSGGRLRLPRWWERWHMLVIWVGLALFFLMGFVRMVYEIYHPWAPR